MAIKLGDPILRTVLVCLIDGKNTLIDGKYILFFKKSKKIGQHFFFEKSILIGKKKLN